MKNGGLLSLDENKLRDMKVEEKFKTSFRRIMIYAVAVVIILFATVGSAYIGIRSMYNEYKLDTVQSDIRIDIQAYAKQAWWALTTHDDETRQECLEGMQEKADGFDDKLASLMVYYTNTEYTDVLAEDIKTLQAANEELQALFASSTMVDNELSNGQEIYDLMDDTVTPAIKQMASTLKDVSADATEDAEATYLAVTITTIILVAISIIFVIITVIFIRNARMQLTKSITEPLEKVTSVVHGMAEGQFHTNVKAGTKDELGEVIRDLRHSTEITESVVVDIGESMGKMASGDFSHGSLNPSIYVGDYIPIREAIDNISRTLSDTITHVKNSSVAVSQGASNMSQGATDLAEGTTDQAAAIQQLTASVESVSQQSQDMAEAAKEGNTLAVNVQQDVKVGAEKMQLVTDAMQRINEASTKIEEVTNTIESIANQTQLLALNASIEAARAGEAGRGFAVVAEEISELAEQSNEAASNTHELINSTLQEIRGGNGVVQETREALNKVEVSVNDVAEMMKKTGETAQAQARSMEEITHGIEQISGVIQNNSATAEESSAVSQELSEQSAQLNELVEQFRVR